MQLTSPNPPLNSGSTPRGLKRAIAAAAAGLLAGSQTAHADQPFDTTVDSALLFYRESGRVQAIEPELNVGIQIDDDSRFTFGITADSLTGATPLGAVPSDQPQTFTRPIGIIQLGTRQTVTTASGGSKVVFVPPPTGATTEVVGASTTIDPNTYPLDHGFKDKRYAGRLGWEQKIGEALKFTGGVSYSQEHDYRSMGGNAGLSWDLNSHNTSLSLQTSYESDRSFPVGGTPTPFTEMSADWKGPEATSHELDAILGITQVMSRRWLASLSYSYGNSQGYHTDPYRIISVVDPVTGEPTSQLYENRPGSRVKQSLYLDNKIHLWKDVLDISARSYKDDWGVTSLTLDARYRVPLGANYFIEPHARLYRQNAADFYHYYLTGGDALPQFASSDSRLAKFDARTVGFKFGMKMDRGSEFSIRLEEYLQHGDGHPAGAPGQLVNQDLMPDLKGFTALVGYSYAF